MSWRRGGVECGVTGEEAGEFDGESSLMPQLTSGMEAAILGYRYIYLLGEFRGLCLRWCGGCNYDHCVSWLPLLPSEVRECTEHYPALVKVLISDLDSSIIP